MTKQNITISASIRKDVGKGASRRLRHADLVPGVIYGEGIEPTNITLKGNELRKLSSNAAFYSQMLALQLDNTSKTVLLKDAQRHPVKEHFTHLDFINVTNKTIVTMRVPLHFINEDKCIGVKSQGGIIAHQLMEVEVRCKAADLPEHIEVDMENLKIGQAIHLSNLQWPKGVSSVMLGRGKDHDQVVSLVAAPRGGAADEDTGAPVAPDAPVAANIKNNE